MILKYLLSIVIVTGLSFSAIAQKIKVKRKGVTPMDVTKKGSTPTPASMYNLGQFTGKWQEVARTDKSNTSTAFKDTLFYNFKGNGEVFSRDGVNMSLMGEAAIEPGNVLLAAADVFTIKSVKSNQVVLDDGEYLHTLNKMKTFWYETLPTKTVVTEKFITPVTANASALSGKWKVYRREAKPGSSDKVLIRILNIQDIKNENSATGELMFYKTEKLETLPATFMLDGERLRISTDKNTWNMIVYKADGKDLVFGDGSLMYYCKPL
jgi:hypothetical protein